jgi:hypothetical protein
MHEGGEVVAVVLVLVLILVVVVVVTGSSSEGVVLLAFVIIGVQGVMLVVQIVLMVGRRMVPARHPPEPHMPEELLLPLRQRPTGSL